MNFQLMLRLRNALIIALLVAAALCGAAPGVESVTTISLDSKQQLFEGWGTSLAWWAHVVGQWKNATKREEILDLLFDSEKGLGLTIARYNIGGGENPTSRTMRVGADIPGFMPEPGKWDPDADAAQRRILLGAITRGVDITEAWSNSPPYWMTVSGSVTGSTDGGNNLRPDKYDAFAEYLTDVVKLYRDRYHVTFRTLDPMNEPNANWWKLGGWQEGCHIGRKCQNDLLLLVARKLSAEGLGGTQLSAPDENSLRETISSFESYSPEVKRLIAQINAHTYFGSECQQMREVAASAGKRLWMSEYGTGVGPHDHAEVKSGLVLARRILNDVNIMGAAAWVYWQAVENERMQLNWGCLHADYQEKEEYWITKQYHVLAQFTRFIRPGARILCTDNPDLLCAWNEKHKSVAIVALNDTESSRSLRCQLTGFDGDGKTDCCRTSEREAMQRVRGFIAGKGLLAAVLPPNSVTTFLLHTRD